MVRGGSLPWSWLKKGTYTSANLHECGWLGMVFSFLEDNKLDGMMAARRNKGKAASVRAAMVAEHNAQARKETLAGHYPPAFAKAIVDSLERQFEGS